MHFKTLLVALCLNSLVVAAPVPNQASGGTESSSQPEWTKTIQNIAGSPFGNGLGNGNGNSAGNGNKGNGDNNFGGNGNKNGNGNTFGNGNGFFSGNSGIGRRTESKQSSGQTWGSPTTKSAWSVSDVAGSPFGNGNNNGNGNTAGSGNSNNGNGNFGNNGNGNGNSNEFGNGNSFFSGNQGLGLGKKVRREAASIPPGTFYLVPPQLADSLNQDFSQLFTVVIPETGPAVIKGALTGKYPGTKREENVEKRQVLTGLENTIAQAASDEAPPNRSGFFGIDV